MANPASHGNLGTVKRLNCKCCSVPELQLSIYSTPFRKRHLGPASVRPLKLKSASANKHIYKNHMTKTNKTTWSRLAKWNILRGHYDQQWTPDGVHRCIQLYTDFYNHNHKKWIILLEFKPNTYRNIVSFQLNAFLIHVPNNSCPNKAYIHTSGKAGWSHCIHNKAAMKFKFTANFSLKRPNCNGRS